MQTYIKIPLNGQFLVDGKIKLQVIELWDISAIHTDDTDELNKRYEQLRNDLGDNFRNLYYQAYCKVLRGKLPTGEKRGELVVIDWQQVQNYSIV